MVCANCNDWRALALAQLSYTSTCTPKSCDFCKEMSIIENQIRDSVAALQSLLEKHQRKKEQINHVHSPIIQLPPEITSTIFLVLTPQDIWSDFPRHNERLSIFQPLQIGAVCTAWRQLAWATPQLWTHPFFDVRIIEKHHRHPLALEWLSRAQLVPVTLCITYGDSYYRSNPGANPFLEAIAATSSQWKTVSAHMPLNLMQYMFHHVRRWDNIHSFLLCPTEGRYADKNKPLFAEAIPSPRSITISLNAFTLDKVNINWCRVEEARMDPLSEEECIGFLRAHAVLESCEFVITNRSSNSTGTPISSVSQHRLRFLTFNKFSVTGSHLLSRLTLPNLVHISLKNKFYDGPFDSIKDGLLTFFRQSRPSKLQKLELVGFDLNLHGLKLLLELVPALSHLHLRIPRDWGDDNIENELQKDPFFCYLAATMQGPGLFVPRLKILELTPNIHRGDIQWNSVAAIVAFLYHPDSHSPPDRRPLKTFRFNVEYLQYEASPTTATRRKLYELTQAGAEIVIDDEVVVVSTTDLEEEEKRNRLGYMSVA
ncbi:hypothetical protein D9613_000026 [Agrocybe pediades]|uniref:F-box domain-containing protein n=1 Tax=Agrocybe pediades TaxID=84607 RepID=A0A8H4QZY3_9AGAR|nr:hypothetical protein D9613_000026 [Agrocybe pediades]